MTNQNSEPEILAAINKLSFPGLNNGLRVTHKFGGHGIIIEFETDRTIATTLIPVNWGRNSNHPNLVPMSSLIYEGVALSNVYTEFCRRAKSHYITCQNIERENFNDAISYFENDCSTWWDRNDFESLILIKKQKAKVDREHSEQIKIAEERRDQDRQEAIRRQKQNEMKERISKLILNGLTEAADDLYKNNCKTYWSKNDYERIKIACQQELNAKILKDQLAKQKAERDEIKKNVMCLLIALEIEQADTLFKEKCQKWWTQPDYHKERHRYYIASEFAHTISTKTLAEIDCLYFDSKDIQLLISTSQLAALKCKKVNVRINLIGLQLDEEQIFACARPERYRLIKARAGSGKTRTLAAFSALVINDENLDPDQVLILAFNNKAAKEVGERVRTAAGVKDYRNARTFHSLAYRLAGATGRNLIFDNDRGDPSRRAQSRFVERSIRNIINPAFKEDLYDFFRRELEQIEKIGLDLPADEYFVFRKAMKQYSLAGEEVKSNGEKFIADFLFEHGVLYKYERAWSWDRNDRLQGSPYHPDFCITAGGQDFILEHWAINPLDPESNVPSWWEEMDSNTYREQIYAKRKFWASRNIILLETHTGMLQHGRRKFEDQLANLLEVSGIRLERLPQGELIRRVVDAPRSISRMADLFLAFIQRAKKRGWCVEKTEAMIASKPDSEPKNRVFHQLALRVFGEYERLLQSEGNMDFDDLMMIATARVKKMGLGTTLALDHKHAISIKDLRWILLDEYQDFSELYYRLLNAILKTNPDIKVVAVGDDWQAINSFAGAQLSFFNDFSVHFEGAGTTGISTNYRSTPSIVGIGNNLMAGRGQPAVAKRTSSGEISVRPIDKVFVEFRNQPEFTEQRKLDAKYFINTPFISSVPQPKAPTIPVQQAAKALKACAEFILQSCNHSCEDNLSLGSILVLTRTGYAYGLELDEFKDRLLLILQNYGELADITHAIKLDVMTAHRAKGKEADTVIVLDVTTRQFPKVHADNQLYRPFGVTMEDTLSEERRLFYVAVTRAERRLLLLTETNSESTFIKELRLNDDNLLFEEDLRRTKKTNYYLPDDCDWIKSIKAKINQIDESI